jgi:hypothetical protein
VPAPEPPGDDPPPWPELATAEPLPDAAEPLAPDPLADEPLAPEESEEPPALEPVPPPLVPFPPPVPDPPPLVPDPPPLVPPWVLPPCPCGEASCRALSSGIEYTTPAGLFALGSVA